MEKKRKAEDKRKRRIARKAGELIVNNDTEDPAISDDQTPTDETETDAD